MVKKHIRIHGDNIVECERTLSMIHDALGGTITLVDSPIYMPVYEIIVLEYSFRVELLSGHGRWGIDIGRDLIENGGLLREGADSYICEVNCENEKFLLAIEYCSALPAGNNAWQRNGRALSSVLAGVPYLFVAELGGVELNSKREVIAARKPNPIVPFSYLTTTNDYAKLCTPVYRPHPSINDRLYELFKDIFGYSESLKVIKGLLIGEDIKESISILAEKSLRLIEILSEEKKRNTTLKGDSWLEYLSSDDRSNWMLENSDIVWNKKTSDKVKAPQRIKDLLYDTKALLLSTIGASDIPICLIPQNRILEFESLLRKYYPEIIINLPYGKPLAVIWITGYKPTGEDSRPDRGLCPMAKMVLGDSCRVISIVYGPAKEKTWKLLDDGIDVLASNNGLWQSIFKICDGVLIDSITKDKPEYIEIKQSYLKSCQEFVIPYNSDHQIVYSEHDIDTAIHQILTRSGLMECLCNPPGGDWSGINFYRNGDIFRWTSLPRVSEIGGKRPDHVFQQELKDGSIFIAIESKGKGADLEDKIGIALKVYLKDLFSLVPTGIKKRGDAEWRLFNNHAHLGEYRVISAGAFIYKNDEELIAQIERGNLDCILAFEFGEPSTVHILSNDNGRLLEEFVKKASIRISGFEIKIH